MKSSSILDTGSSSAGSGDAAAGQVLIVDDDPQVRDFLRRVLHGARYHVDESATGEDALRKVRERQPDLVVLDIGLPDRNGHDVLEEISSDPSTRLLPVVMLTGQGTREERLRAGREGVTDFLLKPVSADELVPRVRSLVTLKHFADEHEHAERVILTLAKLIDARDPYTAGHSGRVAEYADRIGQRMGLDAASRADMRRGALFHDLGKIVVPDGILRKPGPLTSDERSVIEQHPTVGHDLLSPMRTMRKTLSVVLSHHEKLDGSGYPEGLAGAAIPITVRIVTVSDIFDALTSDRAFRAALKPDTALEILAEGVLKGWWDPDVFAQLKGSLAEHGPIGSQLD